MSAQLKLVTAATHAPVVPRIAELQSVQLENEELRAKIKALEDANAIRHEKSKDKARKMWEDQVRALNEKIQKLTEENKMLEAQLKTNNH